MPRHFLLFFLSILTGCSSTATGHSDSASPSDTTPTTASNDALPAAGEPCACSITMHGSPPPEDCCAAGLLCRNPAYPGSEAGYSCSSASNTCVRTGKCVAPPSGSTLPPAPPPAACADTCDPFENPSTCAQGYGCHLVGDCFQCI